MLDAFKNRSSDSKRELVVDERHELERLIQTARTERAAMDETLLTTEGAQRQFEADRSATRAYRREDD